MYHHAPKNSSDLTRHPSGMTAGAIVFSTDCPSTINSTNHCAYIKKSASISGFQIVSSVQICLLFDHDNHAMQLEWSLQSDHNNDEDDEDDDDYSHRKNRSRLGLGLKGMDVRNPMTHPDRVRFVAKHDLPAGTLLSTEMPMGYVNFKVYHDCIQAKDADNG